MTEGRGEYYQTRTLHNLHQLFQQTRVLRSLMRCRGIDLVDDLRHVGEDDVELRNDNGFWSILMNRWDQNAAIELWKVMKALVVADEHDLDTVSEQKLLTDQPRVVEGDALAW